MSRRRKRRGQPLLPTEEVYDAVFPDELPLSMPAPREGRLRRLRRGVRRFVVRAALVSALAFAALGQQAVLPALLGWWGLRLTWSVRGALRRRRLRRLAPVPLPPPPPPPPPQPVDPARLARRRAIRRWLLRAAAAGAIVALASGAWLVHVFRTLPNLAQIQRAANNLEMIFDRNGDQLALRQAIVTLQVELDEMPVYLRDALVTMEDRRFYEHMGVDYRGLARAVKRLLSGKADSGGSTITQQLAKNLFLSHERTPARKLKELLLALKLEWYFTKDRILELYLNRIYFGNGANGIEAAARVYFSKRARELNVYEAALLVGAIPSPERWNVLANEVQAKKRAALVLTEMEKLGKIARQRKKDCCVQKGDRQWHRVDSVALFEAMRGEILAHAGRRQGRMVAITTVDPDLQIYAELAVDRRLAAARGSRASEAALVALANDGAVRALVGAADRAKSTLNHATQARRQLGSIFKPFVYLAALERGAQPSDTVSAARLTIDGWSPRNADGRYPESETLAEALAASHNTATVRVLEQATRDRVLVVCRKLGLDARLPDEPAMALGTGEGTLINVTQAYVPFANGGRRVEPYLVEGLRDKLGRILYWRRAARSEPVVAARHVAMMNEMLTEAVYRGTGKRAAFGRQRLAGKTGTTQENRDAWFVGYSAHLTAGIWVGNDDHSPMNGVSGSTLPAEMWRNFMANAHESLHLAPKPLPGLEK